MPRSEGPGIAGAKMEEIRRMAKQAPSGSGNDLLHLLLKVSLAQLDATLALVEELRLFRSG